MSLDKRRFEILNKIVREYIAFAEPISSDYLKRKHYTDLSSATIRNEMLKLTEDGYLHQPYTSAGRIPTDKGYRYFVDVLIEKEINGLINERIRNRIKEIKKESDDYLAYLKGINKFLASFSSGFSVSYLVEENLCLREGLKKTFRNREFSDIEYARNFLSMIESFEDDIEKFNLDDFSIKVYIGNEMPVKKFNDFGIVISRCIFDDKETFVAILGPKRMAYNRNISLISSIVKILKEK